MSYLYTDTLNQLVPRTDTLRIVSKVSWQKLQEKKLEETKSRMSLDDLFTSDFVKDVNNEALLNACKKAGTPRAERLRRLAAIEGVYVPALYEVAYHADGTIARFAPTDEAAPATVQRRVACVRGFFAWAAREGHVAADPAARLKAPKRGRRLPKVLSADTMAEVLDGAEVRAAEEGSAIAVRDAALLEILYSSGLRVSELVGLRLRDVDGERRAVMVLGKGGKERTVPLGAPALAALEAWLVRRPELAGPASPDTIFLGERGGALDPRLGGALGSQFLEQTLQGQGNAILVIRYFFGLLVQHHGQKIGAHGVELLVHALNGDDRRQP